MHFAHKYLFLCAAISQRPTRDQLFTSSTKFSLHPPLSRWAEGSGVVIPAAAIMKDIWNLLHELKPTILMVTVQIAFTVVVVFYKLAVHDGMSMRVVVAYRFLFASAFMTPVALIVERKSRPKMTKTVLFQGMLTGLFGGTLAQNLYLVGMTLTSATFVSAMSNLVPGFTFIMAVSFGLEQVNFGRREGKAKIFGTLIGIGGAMLLTFYKGKEINIWSTHINLLHHQDGHVASSHAASGRHNTLWGGLCSLGGCFSYALWLIIQSKMSERYPSPYTCTAIMCLTATLFSIVFALCFEKDWSQWRLGWNVRLLTVAYSGIVASGVMATVIAWCVHMRGPLFVSIFNPLMLVLVAFVGSLMLEEKLYLGSVVGAVLIVFGLYVVLWGKGKEIKRMSQLVPSTSHYESGQNTIQIVVRSPAEDKSNHNNNDFKKNHEDSAQDGLCKLHDIHNKKDIDEVNSQH